MFCGISQEKVEPVCKNSRGEWGDSNVLQILERRPACSGWYYRGRTEPVLSSLESLAFSRLAGQKRSPQQFGKSRFFTSCRPETKASAVWKVSLFQFKDSLNLDFWTRVDATNSSCSSCSMHPHFDRAFRVSFITSSRFLEACSRFHFFRGSFFLRSSFVPPSRVVGFRWRNRKYI